MYGRREIGGGDSDNYCRRGDNNCCNGLIYLQFDFLKGAVQTRMIGRDWYRMNE